MDSTYINKVLNGDINAFDYLVSTYKEFAFSVSFAILKNNYQAEEAVQESFIKTFNKLHTFKNNASFKTWFGRIVINESLKKVNKTLDYDSADDLTDEHISHIESSLDTLLESERRTYITEVFNRLAHEESLVLELYYLKEFSVKEICSMTGWSSSKVKMLNLRGRKNFYNSLERLLKSEKKEII